ncbi:MAG: hypothetical protein P8Z79_18995 [Sedimentisphaerales bacterium]
MNGEQPYVSVIEPLTPAIERVKTVLFRPFDIGKWFVIGFCAWLAELGKPKGGGGNGGGGPWRGGQQDFSHFARTIRDDMAGARAYVEANLHWIIPLAIFGAVVVLIVWVLLVWLSSRGRFMFLHCVVENKGHVVVPWDKFSQHANSLFVFRVILGLITGVAIGAAILTGILLFAGAAIAGVGAAAGAGVVAIFVSTVSIGIVLLVIRKFTKDFVVPIMFLRTARCTAAWKEFLALFSMNTGRFVLYILFQIAIKIVIGIVVLAGACVTCGCACCFLAIPYIGTVVLLPILVFERSYSLYYLQQYGPAFGVFRAAEEVTPLE